MPRYLAFYIVGGLCFMFGIWIGLYSSPPPTTDGWKIDPAGYKIVPTSDGTDQTPNPAP